MTHLATYTWKPGTSDDEVRALQDALATLPGLIPEIRSMRFGADAGAVAGNDRFGLVAEFDDLDAFRRYAADARHREIIERLLLPILETRHAVQLVAPA